MTNKRPLKSFIRYDGSGRAVSSSLIWRKNKPKVGNWKEVQGYECCDTAGCNIPPVTLSKTGITNFPINTGDNCIPVCIFECSTGNYWAIDITNVPDGIPVNCTLEQYIEILNMFYSWAGTWTLDGTNVTFEMNGGIASALCSDGELTMNIFASCPA